MNFFGTNLPSLLLVVVGAICFFAGLRAIQLGSRTTYFRHRRDRVVAGWWLVGSAVLLIVIGVTVYDPGKPLSPPAAEAEMTASATPVPPTATRTPIPASVSSSTPAAGLTETGTSVPAIPLSIEALALSSVTPTSSASITEIKFSPEMDGQLAQNPSAEWRNPIRRMYAAFVYRDVTPGAQWTVLWLRDGAMISFESYPWNGGERGRGFSLWEPEQSSELLPGEYEVQFFVGSTWVASGGFTLTGKPAGPTPTLTPRPTRIPSQTPLPTHTRPYTPTPTSRPSFTPTPNAAQVQQTALVMAYTIAAQTEAAQPSPTSTFTRTPIPPTSTFTLTPRPTSTAAFTATTSRTPTLTFTSTITLTPTITFTPTLTRTPIYTALPTNTPLYQRVTVYFIDNARLNAGLIPPETAVTRYASSTADPIRVVLEAYFKGPGDVEKRNGLTNILNGFTGYNKLVIDNGIVHIYLTGSCEFSPLGYSIAQGLIVNLMQFRDVRGVKIYDENGQTRDLPGTIDSAPACLGFSSLLYPTRTPTVTPRP